MTKVRTLDQGDRILTPERIDYYRQVVPYRDVDRAESYALFDSHEALRAKLRAAEADRADLIARRDQSLDDLRQRWEAEIAARKLVEAKLTVAEAERDEALQLAEARATALADVLHATNAEGYKARADVAEAGLARVRKALERFEAASPRHYIGCPCLTCSLSDDLRAALTPAAPEPPKGDPR